MREDVDDHAGGVQAGDAGIVVGDGVGGAGRSDEQGGSGVPGRLIQRR